MFDGEYKYPIADRGYVFAGANVNYRSQTTAGFGVEPLLAIDAYTLLDVRFGYETPDARYRVQVYGRNVLNTYYWTNVSRAGDSLSRLAGQPPTFGIQVSVRN